MINCHGKLLDFSTPKVMGIINITPDSFYAKSRLKGIEDTLNKVNQFINDKVDIIDIGGYSTRPGASEVSERDEINRIIPVVKAIVNNFPQIPLSIDTFRSNVARICVEEGASMINDISGGNLDENMFKTVAELEVPYILMHSKGTPQTMKKLTNYNDILSDLIFDLSNKIQHLEQLGIKDIIIDPGFGFAKSIDQNFELLKRINELKILNKPILAGISRKSMIYKKLNIHQDQSMNGTTALNSFLVQNNINILRVHDVNEAKQIIELFHYQ